MRKTLKAWRLSIYAAALLIGAYAAAGFFLVPYLARIEIEKYVTEDLKRHVTIGNIAFNPFTFATEVRNFALTEADNSPIASFDFFRINFQLISIVNRAWTFNEVRLDHPNIHAIIDEDGFLNLGKLRSPQTVEPPPGARIRIPALRIAKLAVHGGRIGFEDRTRTRKAPFSSAVTPIEFTLTNFRTDPNFQNLYNFEGTTLAGERLSWTGQFSVQPTGSTGHFQIDNLKSSTIAEYLGDALNFELRSGILDLQGNYRIALSDKIHFAVDLPSLKLRDVGIAPHSSETPEPWIRLPSVEISNTTFVLEDRSIQIGRVVIDHPNVNAWRDLNGYVNLQRLMGDEPSAAPSAPASGSFFEGWNFGIGTIAVEEASIAAEDRMESPPVQLSLSPLNLTVSGYSNTPGNVAKANLDSAIGDKGRITAQGDFTLSPLAANVTMNIADFDLKPLQAYLIERRPVQMTSGQLSLKGSLGMRDIPAKGTPRMKFDGELSIANLAALDTSSHMDFAKWKLFQFAGIHYTQAPDRLEIERIEAQEAYGRFLISPERRLNIATILGLARPPDGAGAAAPSPPPTVSMPIIIRSVIVHDGSADFTDLSIEPNFSAAMFGLEGAVTGLTSDLNSRAEVKLSGNVDRYSPVDISGQVNLLSAALYSDMSIKFRNMELTTFNPYSGKYAGYSIKKGKLTTELEYKVENRKLDAKHHIVLDQLEFGSATESKEKVPVPIKLAAALLKDRHGVIDINVPVSGSLDDPQFRLAPLIWKALKGLLDRIVTAPFKLLGALFGKGDELEYLDFKAGTATLTPDQLEKVGTLSKALVERPQLRLDVPLHALTTADDDALAHGAFDKALAPFLPAAAPEAQATPDQRLAALSQLYQLQMGSAPEFPAPPAPDADVVQVNVLFLENALRPRFEATPAQRDQLARARADAVQEAILDSAQVDPERVFLTDRESGKSTTAGIVRMELRLE